MKKVNDIEQMAYENNVSSVFVDTFIETGDLEQAMRDAVLVANAMCSGAAYLGFEYDFNKVYKKICSAYEYNKKFGGNNE